MDAGLLQTQKTALAFWLGRLKEGKYPVEVIKAGGKKMGKAVVRTDRYFTRRLLFPWIRSILLVRLRFHASGGY